MSFFPNEDNKENISNNDDKENIAPIPRKTVASSATISPVKNRLKQTASDIKLILQATAVPVQQRCEDDALLYWSPVKNRLKQTASDIKLILQATAVPVQQRCEDDALLYWSDEFDKLGEDESVVEAFQCIKQSETIHPLLRGFVNNDVEWKYFIAILKMIHRANGKYKFLPVYVGKCPVRDADGGYNLSCGGGRCKGCNVDAFRNCASVDMLLTLHHAISSMTDGVFSAEGMLVPAVVVNGRPHCPLPPRPSKSASKKKQYYCEDVAGPYYQDDGTPYQGNITSPEAVIVAKGLNLFGKLARELDCKPMFINVAGKSGKKVMSQLDSTLFFVHNEMFHMSNISTRRTSYGTREEQTTKVTQLLDGLEKRVELLFEKSAPLKLKGAFESAFVDVRFKYYRKTQDIGGKAELAIKEEKRQKRKRAQEEKQEEKRKAELAIKEEKRQKRKRAQEEKWKANQEKAELAIKEAKRLKQMRVQEEKQKADLAVKEGQKRKRAQEEKWKAEQEKWKAERVIKEARLKRMRALEEKWIATEEERLKRITTGDRKTPTIEISSGSGGDDFPSGWIVKTYRRACGKNVGTIYRYWFSPSRNICFRAKKYAMTFIAILKEPSVDGDEDNAAEVYKARGHKFS
ncbi:predicted protein [Thalassiosira pseudonana CCMP1335]|uniref:MBD domain-containing protein n=1 Tax=Thalassiosira pseudonana TaxID=35128 RepID=B8BVY0_THAPS|nr:predicted protein [Thalassiosira pseudonana CCMP1335]EED95536.1 predicted protein [Thalassiosira pseudonana CCMP1335]